MRRFRFLSRLVLFLLILSLPLALGSCELINRFFPDLDLGDLFSPPSYTEITADNFVRTYSDQLSPNEMAVYEALLPLSAGELSVSPTLVEIPAVCQDRSPTDEEKEALSAKLGYWISNALYAFKLDHPEYFWIDFTDFSYEYSLKSDEDGTVRLASFKVNLAAEASVTDAPALAAALAKATADFAPTGNTVKEKVAYIDKYLCDRITYDLNAPHRSSLIGALVDGKCVCEGYAHAFYYLCQKAGVDAVCIPGYAKANGKTEGHMWNGVFIDGVLYGVDTTWNDSTGERKYLLVGSDTEVHEGTFGETHTTDMLLLSGNTKPFALPQISKIAYAGN